MTELIDDPQWGHRRVDPLPAEDELAAFYESGYYDLLRAGDRAPDLARQLSDETSAAEERDWLRKTIFSDIIAWADDFNGGAGVVLEVGAGLGHLVETFADAGWKSMGLEPAVDIAEASQARGVDVRPLTLDEWIDSPGFQSADALVMRLVLEHVRDPAGLLQASHRALRPGGVLIVEVPNDFNAFQTAATETLGLDEWWVKVPDHLNYFTFESLERLLAATGFVVKDRSTSFPLEMFLLMGDIFVGDPEVGRECHERRRQFETRLDTRVRRDLYRSLASVGLGRTCLVAAVAR